MPGAISAVADDAGSIETDPFEPAPEGAQLSSRRLRDHDVR
jgi:hypothetical protein